MHTIAHVSNIDTTNTYEALIEHVSDHVGVKLRFHLNSKVQEECHEDEDAGTDNDKFKNNIKTSLNVDKG